MLGSSKTSGVDFIADVDPFNRKKWMEKYSQVWSNSHPSHVRIREDDSPYVLGSRGEELCVVG